MTALRKAGLRGKLPYNPDKPNVHVSRAHFYNTISRGADLPIVPDQVDNLSACLHAAAGLPMYGNDKYGDCVWAMIGHAIQVLTFLSWGVGSEQSVTLDALLKGYADVTGFNPNDPSTDQGTNIQDALNYWRTVGIKRTDGTMDQILGFAQIDHTDKNLVKHAVSIFDCVLLGVSLPQSAEDEFDKHEPWTVVKGSPNLGGHAILDGGYNIVNSRGDLEHTAATWGDDTLIEQDFYDANVDEAWIVITKDLMARNGGAGPAGFDMNMFAEDFEELTGQPFQPPTPDPGPTPDPTPPPVPAPTPVGWNDFRQSAQDWMNHHHAGINRTFANAVRDFLEANE